MTEREGAEKIPRGVTLYPSDLIVHFDGACQPPGGGGIATWAFTVEGRGLDHEESGLAAVPFTPRSTNNVAEYKGAIHALEYLLSKGYRGPVTLMGDSQLVARQFSGEYAVKTEHIKAYHERLHQLAKEFERVDILWIPREENARADELTKRAILEVARTGQGPRRPRLVRSKNAHNGA